MFGKELNTENNMYKTKFGSAYVHGDVMWNISHAIGGYKETRLWNFIPYAHTGVLKTYDRGDDAEEFSCGVAITTKGNNDYVIDTKGNIVYTADKNTIFLDDWFESNMIPVLKEQGRSYVAGYINTKGEIAIPFEYQYATEFIDGTALVLKDNKVYTINTKGEILGEETSVEVLEEFLDDATYYIDLSADVLVKLLGEESFEDFDW